MPIFSYQAIDVDGQEVAGTLEAGGLGAAIDKVRALGLFPGSVNEDSAGGGSLRRFFGVLAGLRFGRKSRQARIALFTRELADLLTAGVPLPLSLSILHDRQKPGRLKNVLRELARDVEAGIKLSDALEKHKKLFGDLCPQLIREGERSGRLEEALAMLADLNQTRLAQAKARRKAFRRPRTVLGIGFLLFLYSYAYALPVLVELFGDWGISHMAPMRCTLDLTVFLKKHFLELLGYPILAFFAAKALLKLRPIRATRDAALFRLPPFRKLSRTIASSQLARPLGMFLSMGASFPDALRGARPAIDNLSATKAVDRIASSIEDGENTADSLEKGRVFHPTILKMLVMAGDADDPAEALQKTADACDDRMEESLAIISEWFTGALLLLFTLLAIWVFITVLAMFDFIHLGGDLV